MTMTRFKLPDMTCGHCVKSITEAIKEAVPQAEVSCDLGSKLVSVAGVDADKIEQLIKEAGYSPEAA